MIKQKTTKRALITSALSLVICISMLLGTTYAWFTDSVTSAGNIIKSGTLDVEMWYADGTKAVPTAYEGEGAWTDASTGAIFNYDLWEPGYTEVRHIQIKNVGTLALKYKVQIVANGTVSDLADVIDVYYLDPAEQIADRAALASKTPMGTLTQALAGMDTTASGKLLAGESDTITIALKMQESAGNEYQNKSIGTDFSIQLLATQWTYEEDSFDNQYDAQAEYPVLSIGSVTINSAPTEDLTIASTGEIESATVPSAAANTVFDAMKDDDAESNELTMTLNVAKTGETTTAEGTTVALEIDMTAVMASTKAGVTTTTTNDVTTFSDYVTIEYNLGTGLTGVTATHKGNAMVNSAETADDAGYGIYSYDSATGVLTIKTRSLSPFTVCYDLTPAQQAEIDGLTVIETGSYGAVAKDSTGVDYWYRTDGKIYIDDMSDYQGSVFTVPSTVSGFSQGAFANNTTITTLTFTGNVYGYKALEGNASIHEVLFDGMTEIPNRLFYGCTGIENLVVPEGVTRVEDFAFYGNTAIKNVTLPSTIEYIGYKAFDACSALKTLEILGSPAIMGWAGRGLTSIEQIIIHGENATVDLSYAPSGQAKGTFVFVKKTQTNNPGNNIGLTMYVANDTVRAAFAAEEDCGANIIVGNFPD